jgi:glycosyltransferase involved in cell wall biosynthesis
MCPFLQSNSPGVKHVSELAEMFAEVHVIVLTEGRGRLMEIKRIGEYAWVYQTDSRSWWRTIFDARRVARKQLMFGEGFRADVVVGADPFEAGLAAHLIAKHYKRPLQVHVNDDFFYAGFKDAAPENSWRLTIADFVLKRAECVRTTSAYIQNRLLERYKKLRGKIELLPVFYDLSAWTSAPISFDLRKEYPQFKFILLHVSNMNGLAHTEEVVDGLYYLLKQYKTMGLVIVGDGERRGELAKRILGYELQNQIVFGSPDTDILSCMKSAQVLIHTSEDPSQDELVLKAAASGLPIVCGDRGLASEFFIDEQSILLCPLGNPSCFGEKVNRLLNENRLRQQLSINARDVVFDSIEQDYQTYLAAYRAAIEGCLVSAEQNA